MMKKVTIILFLFCVHLTMGQGEESTYTIKNIAANSVMSNFGTSFYGDDKLVFSSPAKRNYIISNVWKGNGQPFLQLYVGTIVDDGELNNITKLSKEINTRFHEADVTFSKDKKTVYFTRSNFFEGKYRKDSLDINRLKIFKAVQDNLGKWSKIYDLPFNNDHYSVGHPTLSEDQKTLYFVSDMPGTLGKTDIFKVTVNDDGTYGEPVNLGPEVNTAEKEMFPYISGNNELYYSTNGRDGFGNLDVYVTIFNDDYTFESTKNLGNEINSEYDDFAFIINNETLEGYFSSNRFDKSGKGDDDIYFFKENRPVICDQFVEGIVKDSETGLPIPGAKIEVYKNNVQVDSLTVLVREMATFELPLECNSTYKFVGNKENYIQNKVTITTTDEDRKIHKVEIMLEPDKEFVVVGERVLLKLNTIYFDFDKSFIRPDAELELKKAIKIMEKYPEIIVEFGAHCDSRGADSYNDKLSARRADSTVEFMTQRGISKDRLTGQGYGERKLTNKCSNGVKCTEQEHQKNRRTEFVILNPEVINK